MKYFITIGFFLVALNCLGQVDSNRKIKEKRSYQDSVLLSLSKYDTLGNKIFWYSNQYVSKNWNGNYVTMVGAAKYDEAKNRTVWISAHSNVGFTIYFPEIQNDSIEYNYLIKDGYDKLANRKNKNQFGYIRRIQNREELFSHEQIQKMFKTGKKYHNSIDVKDKKGNVIKAFRLNMEGDTTSIKVSRYDENNNEIYFYYHPSFGEWEIHFEYDSNGNKLSSKRVPYKRYGNELQKLDTTEVTLYKYDDNFNLIEKIRMDRGKLKEKNSFKYNANNQLVEKKSWIDNYDNLVVIRTYKYEENLLIEEKKVDLRKEKSKPEIITYAYKFYKE